MSSPSVLQIRRMRLFQILRRASAPLSTTQLSQRLGWSLPTTRAHLLALQALGLAERINYRRWAMPSSVDPRSIRADSL